MKAHYLGHVVFYVKDLNRSLAFYRDLLGFNEVGRSFNSADTRNRPIRAWAASVAGRPLQAFEYDPGPLGAEEVEIAVEYCGICHSDLPVLDNEWGISSHVIHRLCAANARGEEAMETVLSYRLPA